MINQPKMPQNASRGGGVTGGDGVGLGSDRGGLGRVTSVGLGTGLIVAGPGLSRGVDGGVGAGGGASAVNGWVVTVAGRVVAGGAGVGGVAVSGVAVGIAAGVADGGGVAAGIAARVADGAGVAAGIAVGIAAGAGVAVGDSCTSACHFALAVGFAHGCLGCLGFLLLVLPEPAVSPIGSPASSSFGSVTVGLLLRFLDRVGFAFSFSALPTDESPGASSAHHSLRT